MLVCVLLLPGCWDQNEVKDLALVMATGIDKGPNGQVHITVQTAVPSGVGGGDGGRTDSGPGKSFVTAAAIGENLKDADQRLQEQLPRKLYTAHRRIILIGEEEARSGIRNVLDQFGRDPMNRMQDLIIVAKDGTAEDFLHLPTVIEKIPGQEIKTIEQQETGGIITLLSFLRDASSDGIVPIAAVIDKKADASPGEQVFSLTNTAVFKDLKLVGYLSDKETRGVMWVKGQIHKGYVTADIPEHGNLTLILTSTERKINPVTTNGLVEFNVQVEGKGEIVENNTNLDISQQKNFPLVKHALDEAVQKYIQDAYRKAQEYDADVFGFGQEVYRTDPREWNTMRSHWDEIFKQAKLNLDVDIEPLRAGMSGPPLELNQQEVEKSS